MKKSTIKISLILSLLLTVYLPLLGSVIKFKGLPPGYGEFPAQKAVDVPGFNPTLFYVGVGIVVLISLPFLFPGLFGFKKVKVEKKVINKHSFPWWLPVGIILFSLSLLVFWGKFSIFEFLDPVMFVPLWWGFILFIDGLVFIRTEGHSLLSKKPKTMFLLAVISSLGWFLFEYLDFFVLANWYYPNNHIFTTYGNYVWFMSSYTIIFPQIFELYHLFLTFPKLKNRWAKGPVIQYNKKRYIITLLIGITLSVLMGLFPFQLFFTIWINPVLIIFAILSLLKIPTLFTPVREGNWSKIMLIGIAMVVSGLLWEFINFGSELFYNYSPVNPSYWKYSIPYVNKIHLPFSEMPVLGYFGYIPYAWICWLQWTLASKLFGFDEDLNIGK